MYCYSKLIKTIEQETNEIVFVGIAKMNEWKTRAFKSLIKTKNCYIATTKTTKTEFKTNNNNGVTFFSDIGVSYVNPNNKMGNFNQQEFELKIKEITNKDDYDWIVAIMTIDDYDAFLFANNNGKKIVLKELNKMEQEMNYGNGVNNSNESKYFGYKLNRTGNMV